VSSLRYFLLGHRTLAWSLRSRPTQCDVIGNQVVTMSPRAGSTVFTVRVIKCAELIAADLFRNAEQNRRRIVFGSYDQMLRV
jgi:hypothetical protein